MFRKSIKYKSQEEPIVIPKHTLDLLLKSDSPADSIALYTFYYYTAKWQKTNQPKATANFVRQALKLGEIRFQKAKNILKNLGLITDVTYCSEKTNKIIGWFIKVNFIWSKSHYPENNPVDKKTTTLKTHRVGNQGSNALSSNNKNALSSNNKKIYKKSFDGFSYFLKQAQGILKDHEVTQAIQEYISYRKEIINKPIQTEQTITRIINKLKPYPKKIIIDCIHKSIDNVWTGLFPESINDVVAPVDSKYDNNTIEEE